MAQQEQPIREDSQYLLIAKMIPAKYRKIILEANHIFKAVVKYTDYDMMQLYFYYGNFIEPHNEMYNYKIVNGKVVSENTCLICLQGIFDKFTLMQPYLVYLEKQANLLKNL